MNVDLNQARLAPRGIDRATIHPTTPQDRELQQATSTAQQFEAMFVRTLVGSLRRTGSFGEGGGMFGEGPGADTYADWFDQHVADQLTENGRIGIKEQVLENMARNGEVDGNALREAQAETRRAAASADRHALQALTQKNGGIDVLR